MADLTPDERRALHATPEALIAEASVWNVTMVAHAPAEAWRLLTALASALKTARDAENKAVAAIRERAKGLA